MTTDHRPPTMDDRRPITHYALRITHYVLRFTHYVLRITFYVLHTRGIINVAVIEVNHLAMTYRAPVRAAGLHAALAAPFHRTYRQVQAVRGISFQLAAGQLVGFIGPNGAGYTTTLKLLSGVLH